MEFYGYLAAGEHRRNLVTRGVDLNSLVACDFLVGAVRLCDPCAYLEELTGRRGLMKAMVNRGGLQADILSGGLLQVGDPIHPTDEV